MLRRKKIIFIIISLIGAALLMEFSVRAVVSLFGIGPLDPREKELLGRVNLKLYASDEWARDYYLKELKELDSRPDPFVGFLPKEHSGKYINIDSDGLRKTWNSSINSGQVRDKEIKVFVFGGSTTWGAGARDEYTIPSFLSKILNSEEKSAVSYRVWNFGESGHASVQEIAKLTRLLHNGERPDIVIFYDGVNDISHSYEIGIPLPDGGEVAIRKLFKSRLEQTAAEKLSGLAKDMGKKYCLTCRVLWNAVRKENPEFLSQTSIVGREFAPENLEALARGIADGYKNKTLVFLNGLAEAFNFKLAVFWQPTLFTEAELVGEEAELGDIDAHVKDEKAAALYRSVSGLLASDPVKNFYNITDVLRGRTEEYYIDFGHISEKGNEVVARKIVEVLNTMPIYK